MKKLLCLALIFLVSCSAAPDPTQILRSTQEKLSEGCSFDLQFSTGEEATLRWSAEEQELCFMAPDAVEGLCYLRDGGGLTVTFEGISSKISEAALPQGAAVAEIFEALDTLCGATPLSVSPHPSADADTFPPENVDARQEADGLLRVSTRNNQRTLSAAAWVDVESCLPIAVETEHWAVALALHNAL